MKFAPGMSACETTYMVVRGLGYSFVLALCALVGCANADSGSDGPGGSGAGSGPAGAGGALSDPCLNQVCNTPPPLACQASGAIYYDPIGACVLGQCQYTAHNEQCAGGCIEGSCLPADGCPPSVKCSDGSPTCKDSSTLTTVTWSGMCGGSSCFYYPIDTSCPFGCSGGACQAGPACPKPSAHNLLTNPGFDTNITNGWNPVSEAYDKFTWADEAETKTDCASGSLALRTIVPSGNPTSQFAQCVGIDPASTSTYYFGAALRNGDADSNNDCTLGECYLQWMSGSSCASPEGTVPIKVQSRTSGWTTSRVGPLTRPVGASSALVACLVRSGAVGSSCVFGFDQLSFTEAPDKY
jgi:hypothetical protein